MNKLSWALGPLAWQQATWSLLTQLRDADRMPHALMLTGIPGIGKAHCLQALAAVLMCEQPRAGTACGQCRNCTLLTAGSHSDCLEVTAEEGSRVIKVDQVRGLIEFAARTPSIAARKVILLGAAECMNVSAANSILKCLEEPSPSTTLLLYSHQPAGIPATVRSRCQQFAMRPPSPEESVQWLTQVTGNEATAGELQELCPGQPLHAARLYQGDALQQHSKLQRGLAALTAGELSPLELPRLVGDLDLGEILRRMQVGLEREIRSRVLQGESGLQPAFHLRDDLALLQRRIQNGANPNRQLIIEDCATRFAMVLGVSNP